MCSSGSGYRESTMREMGRAANQIGEAFGQQTMESRGRESEFTCGKSCYPEIRFCQQNFRSIICPCSKQISICCNELYIVSYLQFNILQLTQTC